MKQTIITFALKNIVTFSTTYYLIVTDYIVNGAKRSIIQTNF